MAMTLPPDSLPRVSLALSSGGFGGAGGMAGFLSALDLFFGAHPVTAIGHYTGVSAGSIIASFMAAGISPLELVQSLSGKPDTAFRAWRPADLYRPNLAELAPTAARAARAALRRLGLRGPSSDEIGVLPSGVMSIDGIVDNIRLNLERRGVTRFSDLSRRLGIIFYDVLSNARVVAGNGPGEIDLPIAEAIAASAAIPGVFPPRRIDLGGGRTVLGVDGGTGGYRIGVRDLDDVDLVIAYNHAGFAPIEGHVSHVSAPAVVGMSLQLSVNQSNIDEIASWIDAHPEAHAWVFQPPPRELSSTLSYAHIFEGARDCYELAQRWLREHFDYFGTVLANHGVTVDADFDRVRFEDVVAEGLALKPRRS